MTTELPIINIKDATYECIFGRGCDGVCCREGRPPVCADEIERIDANLDKFLSVMRPDARRRVQQRGYLTEWRRLGQPIMRKSQGWCVFFHNGCVLHQVGLAEGDKFRYKPAICSLFPIKKDQRDRWYVRQKGFKQEGWNLFCLNPASSNVLAAESLKEEIALAKRLTDKGTVAAAADATPAALTS
jgi:hypothetical protein